MTPTASIISDNVTQVLGRFKGKRCFLEEGGGNNGDELIRRGSRLALQEAGIEFVPTLQEAEVIVYRGGGSMNDCYSPSGPIKLKQFQLESPETPIVVLPQSYFFTHLDFPALFANRRSPVYLFARERFSMEVLSRLVFPPAVKIALDHDMALRLKDGDLIQSLRAQCRSKHVLVVERRDIEGTSGLYDRPLPAPFLKHFFPPAFRIRAKRLYRHLRDLRGGSSEFALTLHEAATMYWPQIKGLPIISADISDEGTASFDTFCSRIAESAAVITNRLHVGILAAMLGKPTLLREGSYFKITGIYEYSLSDMPLVVLQRRK